VHPYRIAGIFLGSIAALILGFLFVGFLLPSGWSAERSVRIEAPAEAIFPYLSRAEAWGEWTPSPEEGLEHFGPAEGVGSGRRWDDEMNGEGEFVLTESVPSSEVAYDVGVEGGSIQIHGRIRLEADGEGTLVQWTEEGDFGWNPLLGYLAKRMNELQGAQLESSLADLKRLVEGGGGSPRPEVSSQPADSTQPAASPQPATSP
jgi:hypothetical protein